MSSETLLHAFERLGAEEKRAFLDEALRRTPSNSGRPAHEQLGTLQRNYNLVGDHAAVAKALAEVPTLNSLLRDAVEPLRRAFGERRFDLETLESDEEGSILRVTVRSGAENPAELTRRFDQSWWLKNIPRSEASLVFDYETADGL